MKITMEKQKDCPKQGYELIITTMSGDADDYHKLNFHCGMNEETLRTYIIAAEILKKTYPHGRGGCDDYEGEYWELFSYDWYHNEGMQDSMDTWKVIYHGGNGFEFNCDITLEEADKEEIEKAPTQDGGNEQLKSRRSALNMLKACGPSIEKLSHPVAGLDEKTRKERLQGWYDAKPRYEKQVKDAEEVLKERGITFEEE